MRGWGRAIKGVLLAGLLCLVAGCQTQLYDNLTEAEANAVLATLLDASVAAEKRPGTEGSFSVFVEEADFARAVAILDAHALPGKRYEDLGKVFGKDAMFSTPMEEKARFLFAMQEEIAHTLSVIDGVLDARVHLVLPEQDQLGRELQTPSAAVFVKHVDDERHDPLVHRAEIRRLVAASVPNLDEERIVVSFFPSRPLPAAATRAPALREIMGLRVTQDSADFLVWGAAAAGALVVLLALLAVVAWRRGKRGR